jgi:hypothetical protein
MLHVPKIFLIDYTTMNNNLCSKENEEMLGSYLERP